jgi:hypothetical protein
MRKQRTRQHIIEDLGFNHVERQILYAGYTFYRYSHNDYGYDGSITTFNEKGEVENTQINVQLKSTDHLTQTADKQFFVFDVSKRDLELWCYSYVPVILALYDAQAEVAYFVDILEYFRKDGINLDKIRKFVRIKIQPSHILTPQVVIQLRHIKNQIT